MTTTVFSLGHSNRTLEQFLKKLHEHNIQAVVDVRSRPTSRWLPHFNRRSLETALPGVGIQYLFRGHNLGGLDENAGYDLAISEVIELAKNQRLALLCAEGDYIKCHRFTMLTPDIERHNVVVKHLKWQKNTQKPRKIAQKGLF